MNVPLVDYIDLLNGSARAAGISPDQAASAEFADFRLFHSDRLKRIWEWRPWSFLCPIEKRYFRPVYSLAATYTATAEVFMAGPNDYYQALQAVPVNQPPATYTGGQWVVNAAYWAESRTSYSADEYVSTTAYVQGSIVYYSLTDAFYQLFATTSTGNLPTDTTKWGVLTDFSRYVAYEQSGETAWEHAFSAWDRNPRTDGRALELRAFQSDVGLQVMNDVPWCWVEFRVRRPQLTGDNWSATATYSVGTQVYFQDLPNTRGNFYDCTSVATAGQSPVTHAAKWTLVEIPAAFQTYLKEGAAADYLAADTEPIRRDRAARIAEEDLERQALLYDAQVAQMHRTTVGVR